MKKYEIERKFLVKYIPDLTNSKVSYIKQAYISNNPVLRIRQQDDKYIFTFKGFGKMKRVEFEENLSKEEFENLYTKIENNPIIKKRYFIQLECGHVAELDIYEENLQGFINVEVEFKDLSSANDFIPPDWFGEDVTKNPQYTNVYLSQFGIKK